MFYFLEIYLYFSILNKYSVLVLHWCMELDNVLDRTEVPVFIIANAAQPCVQMV